MAPGRLYHPDYHVVMEVDIEDCPVADVPLTEIYDIENSTLIDVMITCYSRIAMPMQVFVLYGIMKKT